MMIKLISAREIEKLLFFARRRLLVHARPFDTGFLCSGISVFVRTAREKEKRRRIQYQQAAGGPTARGHLLINLLICAFECGIISGQVHK
jgi:hypothetical protein